MLYKFTNVCIIDIYISLICSDIIHSLLDNNSNNYLALSLTLILIYCIHM